MTNDQHTIVSNEQQFRLYVVETLGGVKADVSSLKEQNAEQFRELREHDRRITKIEATPRKVTIGALGGGAGVGAVIVAIREALSHVLNGQ